MNYPTLCILFLVIGLIILVGEFFIPSGGFLAVLTIICFVVSIWCAWKAWGTSSPIIWWTYIGSISVIIPSVIVGTLYTLSRTEIGNRVILEAPTPEDVIPYTEKHQELEELIGMRGMAKSLMMPGGIVVVNGIRRHAQSEGLPIEAGTEIEVIGIEGNRIIVRIPLTPSENEENVINYQPESEEILTEDEGEEPLDFNIT